MAKIWYHGGQVRAIDMNALESAAASGGGGGEGSGGGVMIVNYAEFDGANRCDKTFGEIYEAYTAGTIVLIVIDASYEGVTDYTALSVIACGYGGDSENGYYGTVGASASFEVNGNTVEEIFAAYPAMTN